MNPTEHTCDTRRIDDYLDEQLSESVLVEFEEHIGKCDDCQIELQRRAAEPQLWSDAVTFLASGVSASSSDAHQERSDDHRKRHVLSVLDTLMPTDDPEMLGRIGDYEISGVVGVGGMGAVLKGFDKSLRRVVAIKVMAPHLAGSGSARTRFQREARAAAAITHDNVIDTYGVSEANGLPYLVMPFARGPSLQKRIDEGGPLTTLEVVRIGRQIASGLAAAHEQGLVHRDIKPANVLLNEGIERLWITDFGVARAMDDASMTQTGVIAGTPQYMSPEQARGESVDHRSDLFSLGSVLYTACTGRPPFRSEAAYGILRRITDTDPRPIREINPDIPEWFCRIIERLMAKHPADRYQNASEIAVLLEGCLAHLQQPTRVDLPQCVARPELSESSLSETAEVPIRSQPAAAGPHISPIPRRGIWILVSFALLAGLVFLGFQLTEPAEISGRWAGEHWKVVSLTSAEEATGWYTGSFMDADGRRGVLQLEWSRLQRRFNGRWKLGNQQSGSLTLRITGDELRGAVSIDPDSPNVNNTPRLRELSWRRTPATRQETTSALPTLRATGLQMTIQTPIKGRIVRWGKGIRENARVKQGDVIAEVTSTDTADPDRVKEQEAVTARHVEAARAKVLANEKVLESARDSVASFEAQLLAYEQVKQQIAAVADAAERSAKIKVDTAKAELVGCEAAIVQLQTEFDRQKKLFDEAIISQSKFQEAEHNLEMAKAKVKQAATRVQAAENDLVAARNDKKAKESNAQVDIEHASAQVNKAKGEAAMAESEVAAAQIELAEAQQTALDAKIRMAERRTQRIFAPLDGQLRNLTTKTVVQEGETICVIVPVGAISETRPDDSADTIPAEQGSAFPSTFDRYDRVTRLSGMSGWPITETVAAATSLQRRFAEIQKSVEMAEVKGQVAYSRESFAELQRELSAAEMERKATLSILKAQLEAARNLNESQADLSNSVTRQIENGSLPRISLLQTRQAMVTSTAEIRQLELLLRFYTSLGKPTLTAPNDGRDIAREVLKVQLEAARKTLGFLTEQRDVTRHQFKLGDKGLDELLRAEQAEATAKAEASKLEALLEYYENSGKDTLEPSRQSIDVDEGALNQPQGEKVGPKQAIQCSKGSDELRASAQKTNCRSLRPFALYGDHATL